MELEEEPEGRAQVRTTIRTVAPLDLDTVPVEASSCNFDYSD